MTDSTDERFPPSGSSRLLGILSLMALGAFVVWTLVSSMSLAVVLGAVGVGALVWSYNVRPSLRISGENLVLRNPLQTVTIPLIAIEYVRITFYVVVRIGELRFTCPAISRSRRTMAARNRGATDGSEVYPDLVESKITQRARELRTARGVELFTSEHEEYVAQVIRARAWPEIVVLVGSVVAMVVVISV